MNVFRWWRELRDANKKADELKVVERQKIQQLQDAIESGECHDLDAATMCIESITINVKSGATDKARKEKKV